MLGGLRLLKSGFFESKSIVGSFIFLLKLSLSVDVGFELPNCALRGWLTVMPFEMLQLA